MAGNLLTGKEIQSMVLHWLRTPPNGYLGSGYGSDPKALLQKPTSSGLADQFMAKLKADVPVIGALPPNTVNLYSEDYGNDTKLITIDVLGSRVSVDNLEALP